MLFRTLRQLTICLENNSRKIQHFSFQNVLKLIVAVKNKRVSKTVPDFIYYLDEILKANCNHRAYHRVLITIMNHVFWPDKRFIFYFGK